MADNKIAYGTEATAVGSTVIANLADGAHTAGTAVTNATNLFIDAHVFAYLKGGASSTSNVNIKAIGSIDATNFTDQSGNERLIGRVTMNKTTEARGGPFSVANAFGGNLPKAWKIVIENDSADAMENSTGASYINYVGIYYTS